MESVKQKILFVCSANKDRSKTAEDYFASVSKHYSFESAGTNTNICNKEGTNPIHEGLLHWAELIFVMENKHKKQVESLTNKKLAAEIIVLHIKDVYKYYQPELIQILKEKVTPHIKLF